jgi:hypothetical protein
MRLADERDFAADAEAAHAEQMEREKNRCQAHKDDLLKKLRTIKEVGDQ